MSVAEKTVRWKCQECEHVTDDPTEGGPLYECGECGTVFNRDNSANDNHQCPQCNKFASKVTDHSCPECGEGALEEEEMYTCPECGEAVEIEPEVATPAAVEPNDRGTKVDETLRAVLTRLGDILRSTDKLWGSNEGKSLTPAVRRHVADIRDDATSAVRFIEEVA